MSAPAGNVTVPMLTTITVNGTEGLQFLASLQERRTHPVPPALVAMIEHVISLRPDELDIEAVRLEVTSPLADEIAAFIDDLSGGRGQPLLFSAEIGDLVVVVRDVLVEMQATKREPRTWRYVNGGSCGRLVARRGDLGKVLLLDGEHEHEHAYISDRCTTRSRSHRFPI